MSIFLLETTGVIAYWGIPMAIVLGFVLVRSTDCISRIGKGTIRRIRSKTFWKRLKELVIDNVTSAIREFASNRRKRHKLIIRCLLVAIYLLIGVYFLLLYVHRNFESKPNVSLSNAEQYKPYTREESPIIIYFDRPINTSTFSIKTAPEGFGIKTTYYSPLSWFFTLANRMTGQQWQPPFYTGVFITPTQSIPYDTGLIYYLTGIQSLTGKGGVHEYAVNLETPKFPTVVTASVSNEQKDVSINTPLILTFDQPILRSLHTSILLAPDVTTWVNRVDDTHLEVRSSEQLHQGTTYHLSVEIEKQDINLATSEQNSDETDPASVLEATFTTVTPPGIKSISPSGGAVLPTTTIHIVFNEPMNQDSVLQNLSIVPTAPFTASWVEESNALTLTFAEPLARATKYTLLLGKNVQSTKGGLLNKDVTHSFETVGYVRLTKHIPGSNNSNVSTLTKIQLTFDQEVDKASAQSKVTISPSIGVKYTWKDNTLTITPKSSLKYSTTYTVTLSPGVKSVHGYDSKQGYTFAFTTKAPVVTLGVPLYKQGWGTFDCNLVALQMALAYKGVSATPSAMKSSIGYGAAYNETTHTGGNPNSDWIDHYGVHWDPIAHYARSRGRNAEAKRGWSLSGIAHEISNGNPVVIFWYNGLSSQTRYSWHYTYSARPGLHSVVVYGYRGEPNNPTALYVHDPWPSFYQETYSAAAFLNKWSYFGYSAVVVR